MVSEISVCTNIPPAISGFIGNSLSITEIHNLSIKSFNTAEHLKRQILSIEKLGWDTAHQKQLLFTEICNIYKYTEALRNKQAGNNYIDIEKFNAVLEPFTGIFRSKIKDLYKEVGNIQKSLQNLSSYVPVDIRSSIDTLLQSCQDTSKNLQSEKRGSPPQLQDAASRIHQYSLQITYFHTTLETIKDSFSRFLEEKLHVSEEVGQRILYGASKNWKPFISKKDGKVKQRHSIKHLKIYSLPNTNQLVADFGLGQIGQGSFKKAKLVQRIGGDCLARLTTVSKTSLDVFLQDINSELSARATLSGVPNITEISTLEYYNRRDQLKKRYLMENYEKSLDSLVKNSSKEPNEQALHCCQNILTSLEAIHNKGYIHGDLKCANVLTKNDQGYLSDFGFLSREGDRLKYIGTPFYMAPETFLCNQSAIADKKMDLFSLGMMFLHIVSTRAFNQWMNDISVPSKKYNKEITHLNDQRLDLTKNQNTDLSQNIAKQNDNLTKAMISTFDQYKSEYAEILTNLRNTLASKKDQISPIISKLIEYNPQNRPTCSQVRSWFASIHNN